MSSRQCKGAETPLTLIAYYPATIGSAEKPAPSGSFEVRSVSYDPTYRYDPHYQFKEKHGERGGGRARAPQASAP